MNLAQRFFECFWEALKDEVQQALNTDVLQCHRHHTEKPKCLNTILHEDVLRYLALRRFYEKKNDNSRTAFEPEVSVPKLGRIDVVLSDETTRCAFELKHWQRAAEVKAMVRRDYVKLKTYAERNAPCRLFEIVWTHNDENGTGRSSADFLPDKQRQFQVELGEWFSLLDTRVQPFGQFWTSLFLAEARRGAVDTLLNQSE